MAAPEGSKFGIELEFFLLGQDGYPAFGSTAAVIRRWHEKDLPAPPVPELGSFQIEIHPGPWPLTPEGVERGIEELSRDVERLCECAAELGCSVSFAPIVPRVLPEHLRDPRLLGADARSRATSSYFAHSRAVARFEDGGELVFPGETVLACLNEIHIHVQVPGDARNLRLFNAFNRHALDIVRPYQSPIELNGRRLARDCTTMQLFVESDGEPNLDGTLRRVGFLTRTIQSAEEYDRAISTFRPIPCPELSPPHLVLESSVWFWTRLRGTAGDLRVEFRPMDMGEDWAARVRHLAGSAARLASDAIDTRTRDEIQEERE